MDMTKHKELLRCNCQKNMRALLKICYDSHKKGPCAQVMCICGNTGSSSACSALSEIRDVFRYGIQGVKPEWQEKYDDIVDAMGW
ncbi:hypothetical protein KAR91_61810 [Candidatus Pacearchaeota archaeon]|nr:hypothetical protein [Candidatus Pacearchaeota archaeon]